MTDAVPEIQTTRRLVGPEPLVWVHVASDVVSRLVGPSGRRIIIISPRSGASLSFIGVQGLICLVVIRCKTGQFCDLADRGVDRV